MSLGLSVSVTLSLTLWVFPILKLNAYIIPRSLPKTSPPTLLIFSHTIVPLYYNRAAPLFSKHLVQHYLLVFCRGSCSVWKVLIHQSCDPDIFSSKTFLKTLAPAAFPNQLVACGISLHLVHCLLVCYCSLAYIVCLFPLSFLEVQRSCLKFFTVSQCK